MDGGRPGPDELPGIFRGDGGGRGYDDVVATPRTSAVANALGFDPTSLAVLIPTAALVPLSYVVLYPVYKLVQYATDLPSYPVIFLFYCAIGLLTFLKPVQRLLLSVLFGARDPTPTEAAQLKPAWDAIRRRAQISENRFLVTMVDSHDINAAATGGGVVTVSTAALSLLSPDELEGILAHELGHHVGSHGLALPLAHWLVTPVASLGEVGRRLSRAGCMFTVACVVALVFGIGAIGIAFGVAAAVVGIVLLVAGSVAGSLGGIVGRFSEYSADQAAVDLGFGPQLESALDQYSRLGNPMTAGASVGQRIFGLHPPVIRRLGRIRSRMALRGEG
ncbi:MAG TPA: M48 family metalloprotease [Acidimicrobiales bacterium]|jgi:Zn-dependent protease with chaperone function